MREISEEQADALVGEGDAAVVASAENEETHSAVTLKAFPTCYVLGAACEPMDVARYFTFDTLAEAQAYYGELVDRMRNTGTPFGPLC